MLTIFVTILTAFIIYYQKNKFPVHHFMLPMDYLGWVVITFEQPGLPALKKERNTVIYEVPPSGQLKTSSKNESGTVFGYYINGNDKKTKLAGDMLHVWGTSSGSLGQPDGSIIEIPETLIIFIGTEETWIRERDQPPDR